MRSSSAIYVLVFVFAIYIMLIGGCTSTQWHDYSYLYCKVRDADPIVHQTIDGLVPIAGPIANVTITAGCFIIESHVPNTPPVVTPVTPTQPPREELAR